jgi:TetR/AcrR family transcriptional regulator, mexCD-oprJ operon repressor
MAVHRKSESGPGSAPHQRADARRNVEAILQAATTCLAADPDASINEIAAAAGVGRMTLYGHFRTRSDLVAHVLARAVASADDTLGELPASDDPLADLDRLIEASWQIVSEQRNILRAAQRELSSDDLRGTHDRVMRRLDTLITRGRRSGAFRSDVPKRWLTTAAYTLMHAAADEVTARRLSPQQAQQSLLITINAAFRRPED